MDAISASLIQPRFSGAGSGVSSSVSATAPAAAGDNGSSTTTSAGGTAAKGGQSAAEQKAVEKDRKLAERDRQVRAHELAHEAAGGSYTSGPSFTYERGSNGVLYAVAGEVRIDASPVPGDPEATLRKAQIVERAALAPAQPSAQDRKVAAEAAAMANRARAELAQQTQESTAAATSSGAEGRGAGNAPRIDIYA